MSEVPKSVLDNDPVGMGDVVFGGSVTTNAADSPTYGKLPESEVLTKFPDCSGSYKVTGYYEATEEDIKASAELKDVAKKSLANQNEFLTRIVTLTTALLGGGLVLAKGEVLPHWWAVATMSILFVSLAFALIGLAPTKLTISDWTSQGYIDYLNKQERMGWNKKVVIWVSIVAFALAMATGIAGTIAKGLDKTPDAITKIP